MSHPEDSKRPKPRFLTNIRVYLGKAIQEKSNTSSVLVRDRFWLRSVLWTMIGSTVFGVAWLAFAKTEEVVFVTGKLVPIGDVKEVQLPIGGVVSEILVTDGQRVSKGDILIRLDAEASSQSVSSLNSQITQKQSQIEKTKEITAEEISTVNVQIDLDTQILDKLENLVAEGASSELQYLQQKNKLSRLYGSLQRLRLDGVRQISVLQQELSQLESELVNSRLAFKYQQLRSPVDGVIFDLKPTVQGYVVQTSEPILKVVPQKNLEAKISIPSDKIGFVRLNMPADVSIDSFPATDFGVISGSVVQIGSDALPPDQIEGRNFYSFPASISISSQFLETADGVNLPLQAGMSISANLKLRAVSYLQLLLNTFQTKVDSLRKL